MTHNDFDIPQEHGGLWSALAESAPHGLSDDASQRIQQGLDAAVLALSLRRSQMSSTRRAVVAAAIVAAVSGAAAGFGIGVTRDDSSARAAADAPSGEYLLLVHETEETAQAVREHGMAAIVAEYASWAGGLAAQSRLVNADKLSETADWIGKDTSTGSSISGFFLIRAESREEALEIASQSPHARHGGIVEVRAIDPT